MKTIKFLNGLLFVFLLSFLIGSATGSLWLAMGLFAVLSIGNVLLNKGFDSTGVFGEFLTILDSDTDEIKGYKKNMNELGEKAVKKAKEEALAEAEKKTQALIEEAAKKAKEETENALKGEIKVIKDAFDQKSKETDDALTALNRFKEMGIANEKKGVSFEEALNKEFDSEEVQDGLKRLASGEKGARVKIQLKTVSTMGLASISGLDVARAQLLPGIVPVPNRKIHVRDIMQTGRMTASDLHFLKMTSTDSTATTVAENAQINQIDFNYVESTAPSQYISAFLKISRKALDDITALRASLAARLLEEYLLAEDTQILTGNGTGSNLTGLLNAANSYAYAGSKTIGAEVLIDAIASLEENNHQATGVLLRPKDWAAIAMTASTGSTAGIYSLPGLGSITMQNGVLHINDVPIYKSTAQTSNEALIGDWTNGAMLFLREDPIVEFFEQDGTNAQFNQITVRVQGRVALPVFYGGAGGAFCRANIAGGFQS